jgi:serine/threonine protein kinase
MTLLERLRNAVAPRYTVDREIARGGMGIVFVGQDTRLTRTVAIKVLKPELATEEFSHRFLHEAQVMAKVRHPNVAVVHDSDEREGLSYFVMDYIEGKTLAQRLESGALDSETARRTGRDLLTALEAVHRHGIIHRDVKPANIFLTEHGALLSDFGIARSDQDETLTGSGRRFGTPGYWAPEQNEAGEVTRATDIYSAGAVLYEAWTGRRWPLYLDPALADWSGVPPSAQPGLAIGGRRGTCAGAREAHAAALGCDGGDDRRPFGQFARRFRNAEISVSLGESRACRRRGRSAGDAIALAPDRAGCGRRFYPRPHLPDS